MQLTPDGKLHSICPFSCFCASLIRENITTRVECDGQAVAGIHTTPLLRCNFGHVSTTLANPPQTIRMLLIIDIWHCVVQLQGYTQRLTLNNRVLYSPECPIKFLTCTAIGGDVDGQEELFEVYVPIFVGVKCAEYVLAECRCVSWWEELAVDLDEGRLAQFSRGAVWYEAGVPFLKEQRPTIFKWLVLAKTESLSHVWNQS